MRGSGPIRGQGSSPLTRGKLPPREVTARHRGLIPDHAGKTSALTGATESWGAHPRSRGENRHWCDALEGVAGSSPLTRGKRWQVRRPGPRRGLIPAHAGKTTSSFASPTTRKAHPRSRGENGLRRPTRTSTRGSSPLTRGKLPPGEVAARHSGLIPAHAGKTAAGRRTAGAKPAHPRSRGENALDFNPLHTLGGSSPLTRGKRPLPDQG